MSSINYENGKSWCDEDETNPTRSGKKVCIIPFVLTSDMCLMKWYTARFSPPAIKTQQEASEASIMYECTSHPPNIKTWPLKVCWQFICISNDLDWAKLGSLKLIPISNQFWNSKLTALNNQVKEQWQSWSMGMKIIQETSSAWRASSTWIDWGTAVYTSHPKSTCVVQVLSCNCIFTSFKLCHKGPLLAMPWRSLEMRGSSGRGRGKDGKNRGQQKWET